MPSKQCPSHAILTALNSGTLELSFANPIISHLEFCERCCEILAELDKQQGPLVPQLRDVDDHFPFEHEVVDERGVNG